MLTDLGKLYKEGIKDNPKHLRQWVFTPDVLGIKTKPTTQQIKAMEEEMTEFVVEMIKDPKRENDIMGILNIDLKKIADDDEIEFDKFEKAKSNLIKMVNGTHPKIPNNSKFMKIYSFDNIVLPSA